jgi:hypothetical protein
VGSGVYDLYGAIVDTIGGVPAPTLLVAGVDHPGPPEDGAAPSVAFDGINYLVTYKDNGAVNGQLVLAGGETYGESFLISPSGEDPQVVYSDEEYLVAWADNGIHGARVTTDGEVFDPLGVPLSVSPSLNQELSALASDGIDVLVTWQHNDLATEPYAKYAQLVGITYQTPEEMLDALIDAILLLNEEYNIADGFDGKLESALAALQDANDKNDISAINRLNAFIQTATKQRDLGHIDAEDIDPLIAMAQAIIDELESR